MKTISTLCLFFLVFRASATHLLGGYIQAKPISGFQYEINVIVYYDGQYGAEAAAQSNEILICTGDGTTLTVPRVQVDIINRNDLNSIYTRNTYRITHNYAGPGTFQLTAWQENRTVSTNLENADGQIFSVNTRLVVQNGKANHSPSIVLPTDAFIASVNHQKKIVLAATDDDKDSLSLVLTKPLIGLKNNVCNPAIATRYSYPNELTRQGTFKANSQEKAIVWDAPTAAGRYTFAVKVLEWRDGILIGETVHDFTILVTDKPGAADPIPPYEPVVENNFNGQYILGFNDSADAELTLTTFPNPTTNRFLASLTTNKPMLANMQLVNQAGQVMREVKAGKRQSRHEETFDMEQLPTGVYFLRAQANGRVLLRKVVKQ